jgi:hypothetical protein
VSALSPGTGLHGHIIPMKDPAMTPTFSLSLFCRGLARLSFSMLPVCALAMGGPLLAGNADGVADPPASVGPGWRDLGEADFQNVNCDPETWTWKDGFARCTGKPIGVIRTRRPVTNFEMTLEWRHLAVGGNSGLFVWAPAEVFVGLKPGQLPLGGIEVQMLDHGFTAQYEKATGRKADWFTTDGDVFSMGSSSMKPFPPVGPDGRRSFPTARHSRGTPEWNRYHVRAVDGEIRLWVNGHAVSGGSDCRPATGFLCLESEGAPVEFRGLRIRELDPVDSGP